MAKTNYYLSNKPGKSGDCSILLYVSFSNTRISVSVKESIHPKKWNDNTQRVKSSYTGAISINNRLDKIEEQVKELFRSVFAMVNPNSDEVKSKVQEIISPEKIKKVEGFYEFAESYLRTTQKEHSTLKNYRGTLNHLKGFEKAKGIKKPLTFDSFTLDFYNDFYEYLEKDHNLSINTIGTRIKNLKVLLSESYERGLHENLTFKSKRFKVVQETSDSIYLNESELEKIYNLDLSGNNRLDHVRDLFLIGCWTGLRFSDLKQVTKEKITDGMLKIRSIKTGEFVVIPLHNTVIEILEKYSWNLPKPISNQRFNSYLKEVAELSGIVDLVSKDITKAGLRVSTTYKKFELVVSHSARRSFATNMFLKNVPTMTIQAITGHKSESSFMKYIKVSKEQHAEKLKQIFQNDSRSKLKAV